ncbi:DUF3445 domain-containing protein [Tabrizicola sp. J26]|uniref:heme-dependent oxidative N-demethylase family protein n=1 Tax=Alitabrizicola rongguiensis TaxID=2909234 RepID=UPI001F3A4319|nr:DUF3445 domain-containing protein [Tabrizicola rongguiensis]MCF1709664.1 DUF3445 domain-containing protein [Tabrizicola rongguiensis]
MTMILQDKLPFIPWMDARTARLPGIQPLEPGDWLRVDEAFAAQMAERDRLIANVPQDVWAETPQGHAAARELYAMVLDKLRTTPGYDIRLTEVLRPDGVVVPLDPDSPMRTLGRLVQEDLCLMEANGSGEHVLTAAVLCFPASWTLAQKIGRPLTAIHVPVKAYDQAMARRVQRLFDAIRVEQPMWRMNFLIYDDAELHQPRREGFPRPRPVRRDLVRVERQCLVRLPRTQAVLFSIHTWVVPIRKLPPDAAAALLELYPA